MWNMMAAMATEWNGMGIAIKYNVSTTDMGT